VAQAAQYASRSSRCTAERWCFAQEHPGAPGRLGQEEFKQRQVPALTPASLVRLVRRS
jgi:hypothetical protein